MLCVMRRRRWSGESEKSSHESPVALVGGSLACCWLSLWAFKKEEFQFHKFPSSALGNSIEFDGCVSLGCPPTRFEYSSRNSRQCCRWLWTQHNLRLYGLAGWDRPISASIPPRGLSLSIGEPRKKKAHLNCNRCIVDDVNFIEIYSDTSRATAHTQNVSVRVESSQALASWLKEFEFRSVKEEFEFSPFIDNFSCVAWRFSLTGRYFVGLRREVDIFLALRCCCCCSRAKRRWHHSDRPVNRFLMQIAPST